MRIALGLALMCVSLVAVAADQPAATPGPAATLNRVNLAVADMDRALAVYRDILGFKVDFMMPVKPDSYMYDIFGVDRAAKMRIAFLSGGDERKGTIGLTEVKGASLAPPTGIHASVLIIETKTRFDAILEAVKKAGLEATKPYDLERPTRREFMFNDPDGHRIDVMQVKPAG
jgi:catechol 2,3-dioxygenase-like lactoylglutathione lyase family enzyme